MFKPCFRTCCAMLSMIFLSTFVSAAPVINVWYGSTQNFGLPGNPQVWVDILGNVSDSLPITSLQYSLNGGSYKFLSIGSDTRRLYDKGDFCVEIDIDDLRSGSNSVIIRAVNSVGQSTSKTVTVNYTANKTWPAIYSTNFAAASSVQDHTDIVDGLWKLSGAGIRTVQIGYDRGFAVGDMYWQDYTVTVPITVHSFDPAGFNYPSNNPGCGFLMRWTGHTDDPVKCPQPHCGWRPHGSSFWFNWTSDGGFGRDIGDGVRYTAMDPLKYNTTYYYKMKVETLSGGNLYSVKLWEKGKPEPSTWGRSIYRTPDVHFGSILFVAHHVDATFGDIVVSGISSAPVNDPPVISSINVVPDKTTAVVTWNTDEPATAKLEYGKTTSYELGTLTNSTFKTSHSFNLSSLQADTNYYIRVTCTDNEGAASSKTATFKTLSEGTTPPPPTDATLADDFESYSIGSDPDNWYDTDKNYSLAQNDSLFKIFSISGTKAFGTTASAPYIHSHYTGTGSQGWSGYYFSGRMLSSPHSNTSFGVTFLSEMPNFGNYYCLRSYKGSEFYISPRGYVSINGGNKWTGVVPQAGQWYKFLIKTEDVNGRTNIYAKVWAEDTSEPANWQATCWDSSSARRTQGTVGLWNYYSSGIYWDSFIVSQTGTAQPPANEPPVISGVQLTISETSATVAWTTNEPATSSVQYGKTTSYELGTVSSANLVTSHSISLTSLQAATKYYIKITSADSQNAAASTTTDFTTNSQGTPPPSNAALVEDFESYSIGADPANWYDSDSYYSLNQNDSLFKVYDITGTKVFGTLAKAPNIHSHYTGGQNWSGYIVRGRMITNLDAGTSFGVTFLSDLPNSVNYYCLRSYKGSEFYISPRGSVTINGGNKWTGVVPIVGQWYNFAIKTQDADSRTYIYAKVWAENQSEPANWQATCWDSSSSRRTSGTVGFWNYYSAGIYWDSLVVE